MKLGSQQTWEPTQEPRARGCTRPRVPPLRLLHPSSLGSPTWTSQTRSAYLEDRGQVLGHFQSLSLHRIDHILHPGAGTAMAQGDTVAIRLGESKAARDVADWHPAPQAAPTGPGGRGGSTRRPGPAVTWPRRLRPSRLRQRRVRAQHPRPFETEAVFRPLAPLAPLPASPSSSHSLPTAPPPPGPHVTRRSPDT